MYYDSISRVLVTTLRIDIDSARFLFPRATMSSLTVTECRIRPAV
jgi:hypothetical protein